MVLNKLVQVALLILAITCANANGWIVAPGQFKAKPKADQNLADKDTGLQSQSATTVLNSIDSGVSEPGSAESDSVEMSGDRVNDSDLSKTSTAKHSEVIQLNGKKEGAVSLNKNVNGTNSQSGQKSAQGSSLQPVQLNKSKVEGSQAIGDLSRQKMPAANPKVDGLDKTHDSKDGTVYYRTASDMFENNPFDEGDEEQSFELESEPVQPEVVEELITTKHEFIELAEQEALDQGLIEAQIDDVLSSAEFLAIERSVELDKTGDKSIKPDLLNKTQLSSEPEELLNQLDASDLMDYVAEDDLWKEQLTIEDEP